MNSPTHTRRPDAGERALAHAEELMKLPDDTPRTRTSTPQTLGPTKRLQHVVETSVIIGSEHLDVTKIQEREGVFNRSPEAYSGKEWEDFAASIAKTGGNLEPGDVIPDPSKTGMYLLVTGSRRFRACKEKNLPFFATIRRLPDTDIDQLFSIENRYRKGKSIYENGRFFTQLAEQGRYATQAEMAAAIKENDSTITEARALVAALPESYWERIREPSRITLRDARVIRTATGQNRPGFLAILDAVLAKAPEGSIPARELVQEAAAFLQPTKKASRSEASNTARPVRFRDGWAIALPGGITETQSKLLAKLIATELAKPGFSAAEKQNKSK